jgi:hypothetical protein
MAKDAVTKRLKSVILWTANAERLLDDGEDIGSLFEQADLDDYKLRDRVFGLFGLDPKKPHDHEVLLCHLIHIIFGKGRAGAPKKWDDKRGQWPSPSQVKLDILTVTHGGTKGKSVRETTRILREDKNKRFKGRYANIPFEALRHRVRTFK